MKKYLMTPGPTEVPPTALLSMARPVFHHRTPEFSAILKEIVEQLKYVFQTSGDIFVFAGSGTAAMEACVANAVKQGDSALCVRGGKFGERWTKICKAFRIVPVDLDVKWGQAVDPAQIEKSLKADKTIRAVCVQHCETSTATANDIRAIGQITREHGVLLIVDGVSSAGALELRMDEWGVDLLAVGSQKALMTPPGLAIVAAGERATKVISENTPPAFYLDLKMAKKAADEDTTAFTPPVSMCSGLLESLRMMKSEGIENVWARHRLLGSAVRAGVQALGLSLFSESPADSVTAINVPEAIDGAALLKSIERNYGIKFAGGQDSLKGRIVRISTMGYCGMFDVINSLAALEMALVEAESRIELGAGVRAAERVFLQRLC